MFNHGERVYVCGVCDIHEVNVCITVIGQCNNHCLVLHNANSKKDDDKNSNNDKKQQAA